MTVRLAVKIDIDTLRGYLEGLPRLMDVLDEHNIKASVFFSMGPDNSGKAVRRIFRRGFITKMLRTKAPSAYGLKTMLYGTLLKAPMIVDAKPELPSEALKRGHECGIHAWDHVHWHDNLHRLTREEIREQFRLSMTLFEQVTGKRAKFCGAAGWQATSESLSVQDELGFTFCSDSRGRSPFRPVINGVTFRTPQIPSTLPTLDEVLGADGINSSNVNDYYMSLLHDGLNVHTIHTEMEGGAMFAAFSEFLKMCDDKGVEYVTLSEALSDEELRTCELVMSPIKGRAGLVATQGKEF